MSMHSKLFAHISEFKKSERRKPLTPLWAYGIIKLSYQVKESGVKVQLFRTGSSLFHAQINPKNGAQPIFVAEQPGLISKHICAAAERRNGDFYANQANL